MNILKSIDDFLNKITMYRLVLYCTIFLWILSLVFSIFGVLKLNWINLCASLAIIFLSCLAVNEIFAKIYKAPTNWESVYITAFILASIISPLNPVKDFTFMILASLLAMVSKYILAIRKRHIFNPAAVGVALSSFIIPQYASWWMGTASLAPFVAICGLLIARKIKRMDLFLSFFTSSFVFALGYIMFEKQEIWHSIYEITFNSQYLYLGSIMVTEPMTTPPTRKLRIIYGALIGLLDAPFFNIFGFYFTPEIALCISNIYSYFVSSKEKLVLKLKEKIQVASGVFDFIFESDRKLSFIPGQYMEWTLGHNKTDNRGIRRYFTIASSPTEKNIIMGIKFYDNPSSYKKNLLNFKEGDSIVASQLAGDFVLPENKNKKLIFMAGGIGVTPFRSMIKYLIDKKEKRDIIMFYSNKTELDVAYKEIFDQARKELGINTIYVTTDTQGFIDEELIIKNVPDFKDRIFYISGPKSMIDVFKAILRKMGVHKSKIKTDFFPGFA